MDCSRAAKTFLLSFRASRYKFVNVPSPELLSAIPNLLQTTPTPPPCSLRASLFNPPFDLLPTLLIHKRTGQIPALIHFNDHRYKNDIDGLWGIPWFSSSESRFRKIVLDRVINGEGIEFANGTEVTYFDLCPQDVLGGATSFAIDSIPLLISFFQQIFGL